MVNPLSKRLTRKLQSSGTLTNTPQQAKKNRKRLKPCSRTLEKRMQSYQMRKSAKCMTRVPTLKKLTKVVLAVCQEEWIPTIFSECSWVVVEWAAEGVEVALEEQASASTCEEC